MGLSRHNKSGTGHSRLIDKCNVSEKKMNAPANGQSVATYVAP